MKAEHRKELETNALANWMGRVVESSKGSSKNTYILTAVIAVLLIGVAVGWYLINSSTKKASERWRKFDSVATLAELEQFAKDNKGTMAARAARFEEARALYAQGIQNLGAQEQHASALNSLERARNVYEELAPQSKDMPAWQQEAFMHVASAEESLVGSGKNGSLEKAAEYYQRLADAYPETPLGIAAKKRADELRDPKTRAEVEKFYARLNERVTKGK